MTCLRNVLICLLLIAPALGHEVTFSRIDLYLDQAGIDVAVELPVAALVHEVENGQPTGLPANTTAQDLSGATLTPLLESPLANLVSERLQLSSGVNTLPLSIESVRPEAGYLAILATAPAGNANLEVSANLFPQDALHKAFVSVYRSDILIGQYALDRQATAFTLEASQQSPGDVILTFIQEGIHHIFIGPDHILFVLALILLGGGFWSQVKIVTAFTLAHSITLTLATLRVIELPSQLVECTIALSIVVVGLHNLLQLWRGNTKRPDLDLRVLFAFIFGLVHGFGFASVLAELDLPQQALALSLVSFNIGVEIGQVCIVLVAAPLLLAVRHFAPARIALTATTASAALVVVVGGIWFTERAFLI